MELLLILSLISLLAWAYLVFAHHGFWRADQRLPQNTGAPLHNLPPIVAIIPARDEAHSIARAIKSLLNQRYEGDFQVILVDDGSRDGTAALAQKAADDCATGRSLTILSGPPLAKGWTGKLWALSHGVAKAGDTARYLWLTDADAEHGPDVLARLVHKAESDDRDLVSLMIRLRVEGFWEGWLIPAFIFFFQMLYPFPAINNPSQKTAGAAGGCILVRRHLLDQIGGLAALRGALIDDCTLAAKIRDAGGRLWLGLADDSRSLRGADGLKPLWMMVKRTAFSQLHFSSFLLLGTILGLAIVFLLPPFATVVGIVTGRLDLMLSGAMSWLLMIIAYRPTLRDYRRNPLEAFGLWLIAGLYAMMTVHSALDHWRGKGSQWKGRDYDRHGTLDSHEPDGGP
ncbi:MULTISPECIES: glycosyltransferase [unclassified Iodidimonas]|jgi:hopene-associated glycosyltransferase HpnB|uniref:glycosyltransferase n=1 Tax=unclassified Iodidimonas TaxID=2626145 RepID=UPI0024821765|nr:MULTISPECIES: glycosyltransferase [unclassified Iodidimonas]